MKSSPDEGTKEIIPDDTVLDNSLIKAMKEVSRPIYEILNDISSIHCVYYSLGISIDPLRFFLESLPTFIA